MKKSKLIQLLKKLSHKELQEFKKFVDSPFFNSNEKYKEFYKLLLIYAPNFDAPELDTFDFAEKIYTKESSRKSLKRDLLRLLNEYLIHRRIKRNEILGQCFLLKELTELGEEKHFDSVYRRTRDKLLMLKESNTTYYEQYLLGTARLDMLYETKAKPEEKKEQLKHLMESLDSYFISSRLWLDNSARSLARLNPSIKIEMFNIGLFEHLAKQEPYCNHTLLIMRSLVQDLLKPGSDSEECAIRLFENLKANHTQITKEDNQHFYKFLANYYINKIKEGDSSYYKKLFDIYIFAIDEGILIERAYLEPIRLKNLIVTLVKSKTIDYNGLELLEKYIEKVNPKFRVAAESYCRGYLFFSAKKYNEAIEPFNQCLEKRDLFVLDADFILYKIYYETNQDWTFDSPIRSLSKRMRNWRVKYPEQTIEGYINFLRILKQIYKKKTDPKYSRTIEDIREYLESMKFISDKGWLLEKLKELEKGKIA